MASSGLYPYYIFADASQMFVQTYLVLIIEYSLRRNMPNYGNVSFAPHTTSWVATNASQIDFFVTVASRSSPPEVSEYYAATLKFGDAL